MPEPTPPRPLSPLRIALHGARENLVPGLILQAFAVGLAVAYYQVLPLRDVLNEYSNLRREMGVLLPMLTTACFGGVIPFIYLRIFGATGHKPSLVQGAVILLFWFYKGWEVDLLYSLMAHLFGSGTDLRTIVTKVFFDQFIYCAFLAAPMTWAIYAWAAVNFSWRRMRTEALAPGWYKRSILPMLISTWGIWIPAVAIIYTLPTALQLPMQNLVLCFFTLLVETLARRKHQLHPEAPITVQHPEELL